MSSIKNPEELRLAIREIIIEEVETELEYHAIDLHSVDRAVNEIMAVIEKTYLKQIHYGKYTNK